MPCPELARSGGGDAVNAEAEEIAAALPAAPSASFREGCRRLRKREWPETDAGPVRWDQFRSHDDEDPLPARRDETIRTPEGARLGQLAAIAMTLNAFRTPVDTWLPLPRLKAAVRSAPDGA